MTGFVETTMNFTVIETEMMDSDFKGYLGQSLFLQPKTDATVISLNTDDIEKTFRKQQLNLLKKILSGVAGLPYARFCWYI